MHSLLLLLQVGAPDPYGGGKELAALGRLALIARTPTPTLTPTLTLILTLILTPTLTLTRLALIADELGEVATATALRRRLGNLNPSPSPQP